MNQYLARLRTLNSEKTDTSAPDKTDKTHSATGFVGFVSSSSTPFFENQGGGSEASQRGDMARHPRIPATYERVLQVLVERCPAHVDERRWRQAVEDGRRFLTRWGEQAEALAWTARDLFGLHEIPANPHPSYQRLARYDFTGLVWLLQGCPVVALTEATAAITMQSGSIVTYRKHNKPAYGPLGDSTDDFLANN
jgi:hypothetical protein